MGKAATVGCSFVRFPDFWPFWVVALREGQVKGRIGVWGLCFGCNIGAFITKIGFWDNHGQTSEASTADDALCITHQKTTSCATHFIVSARFHMGSEWMDQFATLLLLSPNGT